MEAVTRAGDLVSAPYNPRKIGGEPLERLGRAMARFGDLSGIVRNRRTGRLVGGHQRLKKIPPSAPIHIVQRFQEPNAQGTVAVGYILVGGEWWGYREVDWSEEDEVAANIAANKHGGEWDIPKLADLLSELDAHGYDMQLAGFDEEELEELLTWTPDGPGDDEDPEEPSDEAPAVTEPGDVWCMGPHRLMCGDSTDAGQVSRLWGGEEPTVMILDPPFDMEYEPWEPAESIRLLMVWARGHTGLRWVGARVGDPPLWGVSTLAFSGQARGWARPELPCLVHEVVYVLRRGEGRGMRCRPGPALAYGLRLTEDKRPFSFYEGLASRRNDMSWAKNPACFAVFLCMARKGEVVYDPCAGSGASLLACEHAQNPWLGMEMQPKWADMIVQRWQKETGKRATLEGSAATFDEVAAERLGVNV